MVGEVEEVVGTSETSAAFVPRTHSMSTWGQMPQGVVDPTAFGYNEEDYRAIKGAAERATRSKGRRR